MVTTLAAVHGVSRSTTTSGGRDHPGLRGGLPRRSQRQRRKHRPSAPAARQLLRRFPASCAPAGAVSGARGLHRGQRCLSEGGRRAGAAAISGALAEAEIATDEVDVIFSTTVTGLAVRRWMPGSRRRSASVPTSNASRFGLGCVAGAAGIARLHDYLLARPGQVGLLLAVELCSLTVQRDDRSMANLVASGLFGDGAAAVVAVGAAHSKADVGPQVIETRSHLYPDTERTMGWDIGAARPDHRAGRAGARPRRAVPRHRYPRIARRPRPGRRRCRHWVRTPADRKSSKPSREELELEGCARADLAIARGGRQPVIGVRRCPCSATPWSRGLR